jgi:hypothetical protein
LRPDCSPYQQRIGGSKTGFGRKEAIIRSAAEGATTELKHLFEILQNFHDPKEEHDKLKILPGVT